MPALEPFKLPLETSSTYSIAVVGGGSSAVAFVKSLVDRVLDQNLKKIRLTIFEQGNTAGPGLPYQEDYDCLRVNVPAQTMSLCTKDPDHFVDWMQGKYGQLFMNTDFPPRRVFGEYLTETLYDSFERAKDHIQSDFIMKKVTDINKRGDEQYEIFTEDGQCLRYDFVLLTIGVMKPNDHYGLMGEPGYIHGPFPARDTLKEIGKKEAVGVIGSGLTAIDMALALRYQGHEGNIFMLSRGGKLPAVRGEEEPFHAKFYTPENIDPFIKENDYLSLRHIVRLMRKEFKASGLSWREVLFSKTEPQDDQKSYKQKVAIKNPWFPLLLHVHAVTSPYWGEVPKDHKQIFVQKYLAAYLNKKASVPLINADQILHLLLLKQLQIFGGIQSVYKRGGKFYVSLHHDPEIVCDHIINTTGPSKDVSKNRLIKNLLAKGYVTKDINGGIDVDFDSGSVIDKDGRLNSTFRALGHITNGTYFFINDFSLIVQLADKLADNCMAVFAESVL
ncbi:FAD/NAD(P)-binding protein [Paenibacillus sp. MDMC362]|uniref:FAD/NAD(P)-binding protein n=1 Tax=Paenibacillus sp. MDMC362 TaxID=2977365 RepID=UPI000DC28C39|nr:FAD/NAD(P)-binding protein [Paenibacillus sp. MDMC362]RAR39374.1 hypothetical protein DP091_30460 [Paenibacillus sp. MDMC362]